MSTDELAAAYEALLDAARRASPDVALDAEERADVDWTLCHVALSDGILTRSAHDLATPRATTKALVVDNHPAMDPEAIAAMVAATTHHDRVDALRHQADQLLAALARVPEPAAETLVTLRIFDKTGQHAGDSEITWKGLVELRTHHHIPAHTARLERYRRAHPTRGE